MSVGQTVRMATGGYYTVASITNATTVSLRNLGSPANAAAAANVPTGSSIGPVNAPITYYTNASFEAAQIESALNQVLGAGFVTVKHDPATPGNFLVAFPRPRRQRAGRDRHYPRRRHHNPGRRRQLGHHHQCLAVRCELGHRQLLKNGQLADTSHVTVNSDGLFDIKQPRPS